MPRIEAYRLFSGVRAMRESSTYQAILDEGRDEGRVEEARSLIFRLGTRQFGEPGESVRTRLAAISDLAVLEELLEKLIQVRSWRKLLQGV
jgi:hypothetical protein